MPACKTFCQAFILICCILVSHEMFAQLNVRASYVLIKRIIPQQASSFVIEPLHQQNGKDVFEVESKNNKIILRGNNGVAVASALYYYLTEYGHCQVTWNGTNLHLPKQLPVVTEKIHKQTPYQYRYYLNYCTFNYSMSWWNWDRWQKEIDWMALHGINMPLAITGEEYTWYEVYKEMGVSDDDLKDFFCGIILIYLNKLPCSNLFSTISSIKTFNLVFSFSLRRAIFPMLHYVEYRIRYV